MLLPGALRAEPGGWDFRTGVVRADGEFVRPPEATCPELEPLRALPSLSCGRGSGSGRLARPRPPSRRARAPPAAPQSGRGREGRFVLQCSDLHHAKKKTKLKASSSS